MDTVANMFFFSERLYPDPGLSGGCIRILVYLGVVSGSWLSGASYPDPGVSGGLYPDPGLFWGLYPNP